MWVCWHRRNAVQHQFTQLGGQRFLKAHPTRTTPSRSFEPGLIQTNLSHLLFFFSLSHSPRRKISTAHKKNTNNTACRNWQGTHIQIGYCICAVLTYVYFSLEGECDRRSVMRSQWPWKVLDMFLYQALHNWSSTISGSVLWILLDTIHYWFYNYVLKH